jgi:hypothetical protein
VHRTHCSVILHLIEFTVGFRLLGVTSPLHYNINRQLELEVVNSLTLDVTIILLEPDAKAVPNGFLGQPLRPQSNINKGSLTSTLVA